MHADPADRIISAEGPEISPVSVPRIFAVGLVLPFAHPIRLLLCSILPVTLIVVLGIRPIERVITLWQTLLSAQSIGISPSTAAGTTAGTAMTVAPPVLPPDIGMDLLKIDGILFLALALWLCAWQRAAARGFAEPVLRWLGGSIVRFPGYIFALGIWLLAPAAVMFAPVGGLGWFIGRASVPAGATPQEAFQEMRGVMEMFSDLQWWVIGIAMLMITLIALWLNARLSPLPALVASRGWRGALGRAWHLSHGHGFGLSVSMAGYTLLSFFVLLIAAITFGAVMYTRASAGIPDPSTGIIFGGILDLFVTALVVIWHASLGALVVRDGLSPAEALDPAMFD